MSVVFGVLSEEAWLRDSAWKSSLKSLKTQKCLWRLAIDSKHRVLYPIQESFIIQSLQNAT